MKIFDGNGTLQYYHSGCWSSIRRSLVEVPFLNFKDISVSIYLNWLGSFVKVRYAILRGGLDSGTYETLLIEDLNLHKHIQKPC